MKWWGRKRRDPEIAPDEIFLDSSNTLEVNRMRFEGRIEKPLPEASFVLAGAGLILLFLILVSRAWYIQISNGEAYATASAHNSLDAVTLFAPRGTIVDRLGVVLAENIRNDDGTLERHYPLPSLSHVLGYVSYPRKDANGVYYETVERGVTGLEARYDDLLTGENGEMLTETDVLGNVRSSGTIVPATEGKTLALSIDADLQRHFAGAIENVVRAKRFIAGSGIIMDAQTGAIHAIVSYPSYDSNVMSSGGPSATIAAYNRDPGHPFLDHAIQGVYAPGSVVKPLVASGALTDGIITPNTVINDPGFVSLPDPYHPGKNFVYKGWKALGPVDVRKAIAWSSDVFFYSVGGGYQSQKGLGIDRLEYWYRQFGLGTTTGIGLPGEASGNIPNPAWKRAVFNEPWYLGDTYFSSIGQYSVQVTPIQMVRATAAVANGGKLLTPTVVAGATPEFIRVPVDSAALSVVREGMRETVTGALAQAVNLPYVRAAAKTGTAQTGVRNEYDNSWVVGFFPYEHPRYAFVVVLERGPGGTGSQAVNVMRDLFEALRAGDSSYVGIP